MLIRPSACGRNTARRTSVMAILCCCYVVAIAVTLYFVFLLYIEVLLLQQFVSSLLPACLAVSSLLSNIRTSTHEPSIAQAENSMSRYAPCGSGCFVLTWHNTIYAMNGVTNHAVNGQQRH